MKCVGIIFEMQIFDTLQAGCEPVFCQRPRVSPPSAKHDTPVICPARSLTRNAAASAAGFWPFQINDSVGKQWKAGDSTGDLITVADGYSTGRSGGNDITRQQGHHL